MNTKDGKEKLAIDEDRIQALEAHVTLLNKDLANVIYYLNELLEAQDWKLSQYQKDMQRCADKMAKSLEEDPELSINASRLKLYKRKE